MFSPVRFALCGAFLFSSARVCLATSQSPGPIPVPEALAPSHQEEDNPPVRVETLPSKEGIHLRVYGYDGDVTHILAEVAIKGNLQIVAKAGVHGVVQGMTIEDASPEKAVQIICDAAKLSYEVHDGVWIISPEGTNKDETNKPKIIASLDFTDVDVEQVLSLIATQFNLQIAIAGDVSGKIPFIHLQNKTPRQAVEIIAQAADLKMEGDSTIILSKRPQPTKPPFAPEKLAPPAPNLPPQFHLLGFATGR